MEQVENYLRNQNRYGSVNLRSERVQAPLAVPPPDSRSNDTLSTSSSDGGKGKPSIEPISDIFDHTPVLESGRIKSLKYQQPMIVDPDEFPTRSQSDCLVGVYLISYQALIPLVHVPSFLRAYELFWQTQGNGGSGRSANPAFVSLLSAILLAGSIAASNFEIKQVFGDKPQSELSRELYYSATSSLRKASFARTPSIDSFTAFLISQSIWLRGKLT